MKMTDVRLSNGDLLEININFLTLKILNDYGIETLNEQSNEFDVACKLIYAVLRSNGKKVDEEEALMLVPLDDDVITTLFEEFTENLNEFKKKQESRAMLQNLNK